MNNYELGKMFAPKVSCDIGFNEYTGEWTADIGIDVLYYQTDPCKTKTDAMQEVLGYLEGIEAQIKAGIDKIKGQIQKENSHETENKKVPSEHHPEH